MKNTSIALLICLALWFPVQADALIIALDEGPDFKAYYNAGLCLDKYPPNTMGNNFYTYDNLPTGTTLGTDEPICIVGHGAVGLAGDRNFTGTQIGALLQAKITPNGSHPIQLMSCFGGVTPLGGESLALSLTNSLAGTAWQGAQVNGRNGICSPNRNGTLPYIKIVLPYPLPSVGYCKFPSLISQQTTLESTHNTAAAFASCNNSSKYNIANCVYNHQDITNFYNNFLAYVVGNNCNLAPNFALTTITVN